MARGRGIKAMLHKEISYIIPEHIFWIRRPLAGLGTVKQCDCSADRHGTSDLSRLPFVGTSCNILQLKKILHVKFKNNALASHI